MVTVQPTTVSTSANVGVIGVVHASVTVGVPKAVLISAAVGLQSRGPLLARVITLFPYTTLFRSVCVAVPVFVQASTAVQVLVTVTVQPTTVSTSANVGVIGVVHASVTVGVPKAVLISAAVGLQPRGPLVAGVITGGVTSRV